MGIRTAITLGLLGCALTFASSSARTITVESLAGKIDPSNVRRLGDLACRQYDHIVHLDVAVNWPEQSRTEETDGYQRLIFWNADTEFLFPKGSYSFLHGDYVIDGYFIPRRGGMHQGVISDAFDKVDDAKVLLNPSVHEVKAKAKGC